MGSVVNRNKTPRVHVALRVCVCVCGGTIRRPYFRFKQKPRTTQGGQCLLYLKKSPCAYLHAQSPGVHEPQRRRDLALGQQDVHNLLVV